MALGERKARQQEFWTATGDLPRSPGHPFYAKLNGLLKAAEFDGHVQKLCAPYYADKVGRPSIPPGVYLRMLLIDYFEGIASQRGIAWRCADSRSLGEFLGLAPTDRTPDHSNLTRIHKRLPLEVHEAVFALVLDICREHGLLKGKRIAMDTRGIVLAGATFCPSGRCMSQMVRNVLIRMTPSAKVARTLKVRGPRFRFQRSSSSSSSSASAVLISRFEDDDEGRGRLREFGLLSVASRM